MDVADDVLVGRHCEYAGCDAGDRGGDDVGGWVFHRYSVSRVGVFDGAGDELECSQKSLGVCEPVSELCEGARGRGCHGWHGGGASVV